MTGAEAWSIIAPILAAHMDRIPHDDGKGGFSGLNLLDEAYVITCGALQRFDKWKAEDEKNKKPLIEKPKSLGGVPVPDRRRKKNG